jgi:hypothetical protein
MQTTIEENRVKDLMKEALVETFNEKKEMFEEIILEVFEDVCMANAIKEGENSSKVSKSEILEILDN